MKWKNESGQQTRPQGIGKCGHDGAEGNGSDRQVHFTAHFLGHDKSRGGGLSSQQDQTGNHGPGLQAGEIVEQQAEAGQGHQLQKSGQGGEGKPAAQQAGGERRPDQQQPHGQGQAAENLQEAVDDDRQVDAAQVADHAGGRRQDDRVEKNPGKHAPPP